MRGEQRQGLGFDHFCVHDFLPFVIVGNGIKVPIFFLPLFRQGSRLCGERFKIVLSEVLGLSGGVKLGKLDGTLGVIVAVFGKPTGGRLIVDGDLGHPKRVDLMRIRMNMADGDCVSPPQADVERLRRTGENESRELRGGKPSGGRRGFAFGWRVDEGV